MNQYSRLTNNNFFSLKKTPNISGQSYFFHCAPSKKVLISVIIQHFLEKTKVESLRLPSYACLTLITHFSYLSVKRRFNLPISSENSYYHLMFYSLPTKYILKVYFLFTVF